MPSLGWLVTGKLVDSLYWDSGTDILISLRLMQVGVTYLVVYIVCMYILMKTVKRTFGIFGDGNIMCTHKHISSPTPSVMDAVVIHLFMNYAQSLRGARRQFAQGYSASPPQF